MTTASAPRAPFGSEPQGRRPATAGQWLLLRAKALRAFSFPVSALPVAAATAAVRPIGQWDWPVLIAALVGVVALHSAGNLLNDYFDFRSGVDRREEGDEDRPGRLLVRGQLLPAQVLHEALFCLVLAVLPTAYLIWRTGWWLLGFGAAAALGLYAYTGPPFALKYRRLGEVAIFLTFGPLLVVGAAYVQTGRLEEAALLLSLPVGLATTAIVVGNNVRDRQEDAAGGVRTIGQLAGGRFARLLYVTLEVTCVGLLAGYGGLGLFPRALLAAPALLVLLIKPIRAVILDRRLADIDARSARFEAVLLVFVLIALVVWPGR